MQHFLRSGEFGPVQLGDSVGALRGAFGEPDDVGGTSRRNRRPRVWKYGDVEFHVFENIICLIFCDSFQQLHLGDNASIDRWFFEGHPLVEPVERELIVAGLSFEKHDMPYEPSAFLLRLDSGVELMFSKGNDPWMSPGVPGLFGFQYSKTNKTL